MTLKILFLILIICIGFIIASCGRSRIVGSGEHDLIMISGLPKTGKTTLAKRLMKILKPYSFKHMDINHPTAKDNAKIIKALKKQSVLLTGRELRDDIITIKPLLHIHLSLVDYKSPDELISQKERILRGLQAIGATNASWPKYIETLGRSRINNVVKVYDVYEGRYEPLDKIESQTKNLILY